MKLPAYSVVIPAYNAAGFIAETIASIMAQTLKPTQIIVVDDGSDDDLNTALAGLNAPLKLIHQENSGPGSATTRGMTNVKTGFVATLDADDLWQPNKIAQQFPDLLAGKAEMSFTRMRNFGADAHTTNSDEQKSGWSRSTLLMQLETFYKIGPIEDMPGYRGEMVEWLARARALGVKMSMLDEPLAQRRIHKGSLSWNRDVAHDKGYMEIVLRAMRRRKEAGG
ncbi:MAG: glycosyltransferase family 2 protein [Rhodobacteraceae bacterium]|nr:glycosyltransferase family 2 protein [Paracoccaceae bacterium]